MSRVSDAISGHFDAILSGGKDRSGEMSGGCLVLSVSGKAECEHEVCREYRAMFWPQDCASEGFSKLVAALKEYVLSSYDKDMATLPEEIPCRKVLVNGDVKVTLLKPEVAL